MEMDMIKTKAEVEIEPKKKGHTYIQWIVAIIANSPVLTYGLQAGWISPTTKTLQSQSSPLGAPLSDYTMGVVASLMPISALLSVPVFTYVAERYGRKKAILLISVPHFISWLLKLISPSSITLIIARICCGIAAGGCFNAIPMYTKEISQDDIRGLLGSLLIFFHNLGIFLMYVIGAYLDYYTVLYVVVGLPVLSFLLMLKCPESPGFLVKIGKYDEGVKLISSLRGLEADDKCIQNEVDAMRKEDEYYKTLPSFSLIVILRDRAWRKAFVLVVLLVGVQTFSGNFAVIRAKLMCIAMAQSWVMTFIQLAAFAPITSAFGMHTMFFFFAGVNLFGLFVLPNELELIVVSYSKNVTMGLLSDPEYRSVKWVRVLKRIHRPLCFLCYFGALVWFVMLGNKEFNNETYFSENALLPGLVTTEFNGESAASKFYEELLDEIQTKYMDSEEMPVPWLVAKMSQLNLEVYTHNFTLDYPMGQGQHEQLGMQAWLEAYHGIRRDSETFYTTLGGFWEPGMPALDIGSWASLGSLGKHLHKKCLNPGKLTGRSGSIQAAINLEFHTPKIKYIEVKVEGLNGQLPNLDLGNLVHKLCVKDALDPAGAPPKVNALTSANFYRLGIALESILRSLNNLALSLWVTTQQENEDDKPTKPKPKSDSDKPGEQESKEAETREETGMRRRKNSNEVLGDKEVIETDKKVKKTHKRKNSDVPADKGLKEESSMSIVNVGANYLLVHFLGYAVMNSPVFLSQFGSKNEGQGSEVPVYYGLVAISLILTFLTPFLPGLLRSGRMTYEELSLVNILLLVELATVCLSVGMHNYPLGLAIAVFYTPLALIIGVVIKGRGTKSRAAFPEDGAWGAAGRGRDAAVQAVMFAVSDSLQIVLTYFYEMDYRICIVIGKINLYLYKAYCDTARILQVCWIRMSLSITFSWPSFTVNLFKSENTTLHRPMTGTEAALFGSLSSIGAMVGVPIAVYISEICQPSIRGTMASFMIVSYCLGMLWSYLIGGFLDYNPMCYACLSIAVAGLAMAVFLRESPVFLMRKGREEISSMMSMLIYELAWFCTFVVLFAFAPLVNLLGLGTLFYIFSVVCFFTTVYTYYKLPETKGLTIDAIQKLFLKK
ncbi:hypothetical protein MSG28_013837 [Choristoneura fumiferana]|uniref:Uncharacterized protein n=1 Tax=Choristoneura fumiferana TaxID=7141 RepID=A0ACC0K9K7_CHOFU|nr:hypothetical protein MSG28_013837 [Choristoneura fumiferana]